MTSPETTAAILQSVDELFDAQLDFLSRIVRCRSLRGQESDVQQLIEAELAAKGWDLRRIPTLADPKDPRFSPGAIDYSGSWNLLAKRGPESVSLRGFRDTQHLLVWGRQSSRICRSGFATIFSGGFRKGQAEQLASKAMAHRSCGSNLLMPLEITMGWSMH